MCIDRLLPQLPLLLLLMLQLLLYAPGRMWQLLYRLLLLLLKQACFLHCPHGWLTVRMAAAGTG
jgi:hypothetical protein